MNIYEIAQKAGVSIATVSRVLNNSPKVSEKTRARITELIAKENYLPSAHARGLSGAPGKTIGIMTIDIRDQYFASVIHSIEQQLSLHQYNLILCNTGGELSDQRNYISLLMQKKVDAIILVGSVFNYPQLEETLKQVALQIPIIIVNENLKGSNIYSIVCDESTGVASGITYLYNKGHRDFAYIKVGNSYSSKRKIQGFYNMPTIYPNFNIENRVLEVEQGLDAAYNIVDKILEMNPRPTAIICGEDLTALGIVQGLVYRNYQIPKDFAIIGFNNAIYSKCSIPSLTTVDSQSSAMGLSAARLTLDVLNKRQVPILTTITTELIIRNST